jgi:hypothetical protein
MEDCSMVKMIFQGFFGFLLLLLCMDFLDVGAEPARAFEKSEHFHTQVDPRRLDNQLQLIANAIDRLEKAVDSLRDRVDLLETETGTSSQTAGSDSVFFAYDLAGGQTISSGQDFINIDTEVREDAIYTHATDDYAVAIESDGWYRITAEVSCDPVNNVLSRAELLLFFYSGSWAQIPGGISTAGGAGSAMGRYHMIVSVIKEFSAGDSVAIKIGAANDDMTTQAQMVRLAIEKVN